MIINKSDENPSATTTEALVLRVAACRENGAVVTCLSPSLGRMAFYENGARGMRADLFQLLEVTAKPSRRPGDDGDFYQLTERTLVADYSGVANDYAAYQATCWLAGFTLRNTLPHMPMPRYFAALKGALRRLCAQEAPPEAMLTGAGLVFLYENGWLDTTQMSPQEISQCETLLNMALELAPPPDLAAETWSRLWEWTQGRLAASLPN